MAERPFLSVNPATGRELGRIPFTRARDLDRMLEASERAAGAWRALGVEGRGHRLLALADRLEGCAPALAAVMARELGKPIAEGEAEVRKCALGCRHTAANAAAILEPEPHPSDAALSYVRREPLGLILAVMPWNFPFWQVFRFAAGALAAGNTVLVKPAPNAGLCAGELARLAGEAGLADGVLGVAFLRERDVEGAIADPRVRGVTVTGSTRAGRAVAALAGRHLKKCVLELGGSDPFIVLEDADLEAAASTGAFSRLINGGQSCIAAKRFLVQRTIHVPFVELLRSAMKKARMGDPARRETTLGPLARRDLRDELARQVAASVGAGARVVLGGKMPARKGWFYPPTILDSVPGDCPAWKEETFGPVAAVRAFDSDGEALALANDTPYGLGASVWTRSYTRAARFIEGIESGSVFVNGLVKSDPRLPFGGVKDSGIGRELARDGILEFTTAKAVWIK